MELDGREGLFGGFEIAFRARRVGITHLLQRLFRHPVDVGLLIDVAVSTYRQPKFLGQRVDHGHAHTMQPAGNLIAAVIEFAARVKRRHDDLGSRYAFFRMDVDRDTTPIVPHGNGFTRVDDDLNFVAVPC